MPKFHFGIIAGWIREGRCANVALPANGILWKGRQQEGLDGLDRCPGSFFLWNRRPRNRSFQPAHPFSPFRQLEPMARPVQKFQYAGFGTRQTMACCFSSNYLPYRHLVETVASLRHEVRRADAHADGLG